MPLDFMIVGPGAIGCTYYPAALERVAERRYTNGWGLDTDWRGYDVLVAPADCSLLGRDGWLITGGEVHTALVVDCSQGKHKEAMMERGLLADVNRPELSRQKAWLVLR